MAFGTQQMDRVPQRASMRAFAVMSIRAFAVMPTTGKDVADAAGGLTFFPDQGGVLQFVQLAARKIHAAQLLDRTAQRPQLRCRQRS